MSEQGQQASNYHNVTYQYYSSGNNARPSMDQRLADMLARALPGKTHIIHVGTTGDNNHTWGKHIINPPQAIDIQKVYINDILAYDCRYLSGKRELARRISSAGGGYAHRDDDSIRHLHVEI